MGGLVTREVGCVQFPVIHLPLCSGHGRCVLTLANGTETDINIPNLPNSQCLCDVGWSGHNDLITYDTHDCGINTFAIFIIWTLVFLSCFFSLCLIGYKLIYSYIRFHQLQEEQKLGGTTHQESGSTHSHLDAENPNNPRSTHMSKPRETGLAASSATPHLSTWSHTSSDSRGSTTPLKPANSSLIVGMLNSGPIVGTVTGTLPPPRRYLPPTFLGRWKVFFSWNVVNMALICLLPNLGLMSLSIYRMVYPLRGIAVDIVATVLYIMGGMGMRVGYCYQSLSWLNLRKKLIRFTEEDLKKAEQAIHRVQTMIKYSYLPELVEVFLLLVLCFQQNEANLLTFLYYHFTFAANMLSCYGFYTGAKSMANILSQGLDVMKGPQKSAREKALFRINAVLKQQKQAIQFNVPFLLLCAYAPWLRSKISYSWILIMLMPMTMASQVWVLHPPDTILAKKPTGGSSNVEMNERREESKGGANGGSSGGVGVDTSSRKTKEESMKLLATLTGSSSGSGETDLMVDTATIDLKMSPTTVVIEEGEDEDDGDGDETRTEVRMDTAQGVEQHLDGESSALPSPSLSDRHLPLESPPAPSPPSSASSFPSSLNQLNPESDQS